MLNLKMYIYHLLRDKQILHKPLEKSMIYEKGTTGAIIVAAGKGSRMGLGYNKVLAQISGKMVIEWTVERLIKSKLIDSIVLVISPEDEELLKGALKHYSGEFDIIFVHGGEDRQDSVCNGLLALPESVDIVLVHDGARPLIDSFIIERSIRYAQEFGAACAGMPVKDTVKVIGDNNQVISTPDRSSLWNAQTPQSFKKDIILKAYESAAKKGLRRTDDAGIAEADGIKVTMFEGSYSNIKLTSAEDLLFAELIIANMYKENS